MAGPWNLNSVGEFWSSEYQDVDEWGRQVAVMAREKVEQSGVCGCGGSRC